MNKIYLLILISNSILISMDKPLEPDTKFKNVRFSPEALDKLALTQELILAVQTPVIQSPVPPPQIPRTKLSPGERFPTRPELSPNKLNLAHRDSAPDIDGQRVTEVRTFAHLRSKDGSIQ